MEKIVELVAPRSQLGLVVKAILLVASFTAVDYIVSDLAHSMTDESELVSLLVTFLIGAPFAFGIMTIMIAQRKLKERLLFLSETDQLTGLPNRSAFFARADKLLDEGQNSAVLMIDVDNFKHINDTYGHYAGDVALAQIGRHLRKNLRAEDAVGRIGGEEFAVLLKDGEFSAVDRTTSKICDTIMIDTRRATDTALQPFAVTFSIGAVIALPGQKLIDLMKFADEALYQAKSSGRNRVVLHRAEDHEFPPQLAS
tara:strand:+ start:115 stop:879 length:765 start_codon:yes stop_codon:yes gene_type:complete